MNCATCILSMCHKALAASKFFKTLRFKWGDAAGACLHVREQFIRRWFERVPVEQDVKVVALSLYDVSLIPVVNIFWFSVNTQTVRVKNIEWQSNQTMTSAGDSRYAEPCVYSRMCSEKLRSIMIDAVEHWQQRMEITCLDVDITA